MSIFILSFRDLPGNIKHTENDRKDQAQQTDDDCQKCEKFRQCHATSPLSAQDLRGRKLSKVPTRGPVSCETDFRARSQPPAFLTQRSYRHFWRQHQYSIRIDKEQLKIVPFSSFFARKMRKKGRFSIALCRFLCYTGVVARNGGKSAVSKTQAADSLLGNLFRKKLDPGWGLLKVFSPGGLVPKGGMSHDIV